MPTRTSINMLYVSILFTVIYSYLQTLFCPRTVSSEDEPVIGVVGSSSYLSCNMTPPAVTDKVTNISRYLDI